MPVHSSRQHNQRGATLVLFVVMLTLVLIPMIGLAVDAGWMYYAHARLVAAADSAALAGARSLNVGQTLTAQQGNAQSIATQYIQANIPSGILNSSNLSIPLPSVVQTSTHLWTVSVNPTLTVNLFFMPILGFRTASVSAYAQSSRRDVNVVLTLDRSGSMGQVCSVMKNDAISFVSKFTNGRDTVGLITFTTNANADFPSSTNFQTKSPNLVSVLNTLQCGGGTGSAAALTLAHQQILSVAQPGAMNVIVFFTDGVPNGFAAGPQSAPGFVVKSSKVSSCGNKTLVPGSIADDGVPGDDGFGIIDGTPVPITSTATKWVSIGNCTPNYFAQMSNYFVGIPETDAFGNSATLSNFAPVTRNSSGNIQFSSPNSDAVSENAADDAAKKARADGIYIYTIGLDGNGGVNNTLLERFANDPNSPIYDSTQPSGMYYYSPNAGQLASIFDSIASQILRIAQ